MENKFRITLAAARVNAGYIQEDACKLIGVSKNRLISWKAEKRTPSPEFVKKIQETYKISYNNLNFLIYYNA